MGIIRSQDFATHDATSTSELELKIYQEPDQADSIEYFDAHKHVASTLTISEECTLLFQRYFDALDARTSNNYVRPIEPKRTTKSEIINTDEDAWPTY